MHEFLQEKKNTGSAQQSPNPSTPDRPPKPLSGQGQRRTQPATPLHVRRTPTRAPGWSPRLRRAWRGVRSALASSAARPASASLPPLHSIPGRLARTPGRRAAPAHAQRGRGTSASPVSLLKVLTRRLQSPGARRNSERPSRPCWCVPAATWAAPEIRSSAAEQACRW